nr:HNH endonuclease family protein [Bacteroidales bacterium]
ASTDLQPEEAVATIEHILPENPGSVWEDFFAIDVQEDFMYRIGNYGLLEASINNKLDNNMPFNEKREKYKNSNYKLCNEYCNYEIFTPKEISLRQGRMAKIAKSIWKSSYISM